MEPSAEGPPKNVKEMARAEYYSATLLKFSDEPEKKLEKERQEKHDFRSFWLLAVPLGFVCAMLIAVATNPGNTGFFIIWAGSALLLGIVFSSMRKGKTNA